MPRIRILSAIQRAEHVEPSKLTLGQFLADRWLLARESSLRPSTFESYARNVRVHIAPKIDSVRLQGMAADQLNSFYADRLSSATSPTRPTRHRRRQRGPRRRRHGAQARCVCSSSTSTATA